MRCAIPDVVHSVVHLLMDFVQGDGAIDVIQFVRQSQSVPDIRRSVLEAVDNFSEIRRHVCRVALWVLGEYCEEWEDIEAHWVPRKHGRLPLTPVRRRGNRGMPAAEGSTVTTKSVLLSDGTYGTETIVRNSAGGGR